MADSDPIKRLQESGVVNLDQLREEQQQALSSLTPEEVDTLIRVGEKLHAGNDVQGYARGDDTGNIYY